MKHRNSIDISMGMSQSFMQKMRRKSISTRDNLPNRNKKSKKSTLVMNKSIFDPKQHNYKYLYLIYCINIFQKKKMIQISI